MVAWRRMVWRLGWMGWWLLWSALLPAILWRLLPRPLLRWILWWLRWLLPRALLRRLLWLRSQIWLGLLLVIQGFKTRQSCQTILLGGTLFARLSRPRRAGRGRRVYAPMRHRLI